jgi:hypothetical protein
VQNAVNDQRVGAVALVAPWLHNADLVHAIYGGPEGVRTRLEAGRRALARYERTGEVQYVPAISNDEPLAPMPLGMDIYENPERGGIKQWPNQVAVQAWPEWLQYDPMRLAPFLTAPLLVVHSEDAAVPQGARAFLGAAAGTTTALWTAGTQLDFYDQEPQVSVAVQAAAEHFRAAFAAE